MNKKRLLDICSGYGGASKSFTDWEVLHIDIDPHFKPDICADVTKLNALEMDILRKFKPDLVWCSPPCTEFSFANREFRRRMKEEGAEPNMDIVLACKEIIDELQPTWWIMENVRGSERWISQALNQELRHKIYSWYFWGNFPLFNTLHGDKPKKDVRLTDNMSDKRERSRIRSIIPYSISAGLKKAIESQATLGSFEKGIDIYNGNIE